MSQLKTRIMRRVYAIWMLRAALSARSIKIMIILVSLWQIKHLISVRAVLANAPGFANPTANFNFFSYALLHTQSAVQYSIFASAILMLWLARDIFKHQPGYWF